MATYQVDLQFKSKTQAIDDAANKLNSVQNTIKALSGRDPFSALAQGAQGLANASKAAKQQLSDQTSAIRAQQVAQRDLIKELESLKKKQIELAAAAKSRANGGAYTKDEIQGLKNVAAQIDQTSNRYKAGKITLIAYRQEIERLNKAQAGGGGGIGGIGGIGGKLTGLAEQFAPALGGISAIAGTAALAAAGVAAMGAAVVATIKPMVDFTNEVDRNRQQLTMFTHDAAVTEGIINSLQRTADATSLGLPGLLSATKTMAAYGIEASNAGAATKMLGDLAMGDNEKLQRFSVNLAQISSLGKAYTVDLKQFGMAGIPIFAALSKTMGKGTAEIMKMAEEGKITYPIVIKALQSLTAAGADFYNGAETGGTDLDRAMNQLTGAWEKLSIVIGNAVTPLVVATMKTMADVLLSIVNLTKDITNEFAWFGLGIKDAFSKNELLRSFALGVQDISKWFGKLGESKFLMFLMNPGAMMLPPGLKELISLALMWQDGKDKDPKKKVDNNAANELERRKLAESALAQARTAAIEEHAKLEKTLAKDRAALDKQTGRSLADAARGYAEQLADFKINQVEKIRSLERSIMDERRTAEFKLAQDRQKLLDDQKQGEYGDRISAAKSRGEDTGGLEIAQKLAAVSSKANADRRQAAFDLREKEMTLQRRIADFQKETQKQLGEMQKGYARQVEGIYRTAAQTLNDKLIAAAVESKRILESVKIPVPSGAAAGGTETAGTIPGAGTKAASKAVDAASKNLGLMAGISEQCANSLRALFKASKINIGVTKKAWDGMSTSAGMANSFFGDDIGVKITNIKDLRKGDLIAFDKTYGNWGKGVQTHVGMAAGDGQMFDHSKGKGLTKRSIEGTFPGKFMYGIRPHEYQRGEQSQAEINTKAKAMLNSQQPKQTQQQSAFLNNFPVKNKNPFDISNFDASLMPKAKPVVAKPAQAKLPTQIKAPGEAALRGAMPANGIRPSTLGGGGLPAAGAGMAGAIKGTQDLTANAKAQEATAELSRQQELQREIKALIGEINLGRTADLKSQQLKNELDVATLDLMKSGVTPELAAQLALNQQQSALSNERLNQLKLDIEQTLQVKGLTEQARKEQELKLKLINDQIAANPALLAGLDEEAKKTKAIGEARTAFTDSQKLKNHMDGMRKELNDTQGQVIKLSSAIESELGSAMSGAVSGMIDGTLNVQQAFSSMFANIGKAFIDMATQMIAKAIMLKAMGILFPGLDGASALPQKLGPGFAAGGKPPVGVPSLIGEAGPELFIPGQTGLVVPNDIFSATRKALGEGGGGGDQGGAAFAENQQAIAQGNSVNRERSIQQDFNSAMEAGYEPINVKVDAFDPSAAGLVTVGQLEQSNKMAVAQAQAKIMQKFKNNPGVRAGAGLR